MVAKESSLSTKGIIGRNVKYSTIGNAIAMGLQFMLLPFIISHVGKEIYGAYILVMTFTGYLGLLDLGMSSAVVKFVAEFSGEGDKEKMSRIISASLSFYTVLGLVCGIILFVSSFYFDTVFSVKASNERTVKELLWVAALASIFVWPSSTFDGVLRGIQRYDLRAIIRTSVRICTAAAAYFIFTMGYSMVHFLAISYFFILIGNLFSYVLSCHCIQGQKIIFPYFNRETFRIIFAFSFFLFLGSLTTIIMLHIDDYVIGVFVSVSAVTLYNVAFTLQQGLRSMHGFLGGPLMPACAEMEGRKDYKRQKMLIFKGTKYTTAALIPVVIITIAFARPLISYWMGEGFEESVLPAQVLIAFWLFNPIVSIVGGALVAKGHTKILFNISLISAIANLILSLVLVKYWGILGVVLGTTLSMVLISWPLVLRTALKTLNIGFREFFDASIKDNLRIYAITFTVSVLTIEYLCPSNLFMTLLSMAMIYGISLLLGFFISFSARERQEILAVVKG